MLQRFVIETKKKKKKILLVEKFHLFIWIDKSGWEKSKSQANFRNPSAVDERINMEMVVYCCQMQCKYSLGFIPSD